MVKNSVVWQFASGFVLGTLALIAFQPADATHALAGHLGLHHAEVR